MIAFESREEYDAFFSGSPSVKEKNAIEFCKFGNRKLLIVAPHAGTAIVKVEHAGKVYRARVGDLNTDVLAKIAAFNCGASCLISYVPRHLADFARSPNKIGKGELIKAIGKHDNDERRVPMKVHRDKSYKQLLEKFHSIIKKERPRYIVSFHGKRGKIFDAIIGVGKDFRLIGGKRRFELFKSKLSELLAKEKLKLKLRFTTSRFSGERDYTLDFYSRALKSKCLLIEFDLRGRRSFPSISYQKLACLLCNAMLMT